MTGAGASLTRRQKQVLYLTAHGFNVPEIAARLHLSEHTVRSYTKSMLHRMGAKGRAHAVSLGYQRGILPLKPRAHQDAV